jgi:hypothetical protein
MLKGYQEENEKQVNKNKGLERDLKAINEKLISEQKRVKELQQKVLLEREKVFVEDKKDELDIDTVNTMGLSNAISQKQLTDLHSQLQRLQVERLDLDRDFNIREAHLKSQINRLRDEKASIEKQLYDTEYMVGEKDKELNKVKEEWIKDKETLKEEISQLQDKISFFRQNQKLLTEQESES